MPTAGTEWVENAGLAVRAGREIERPAKRHFGTVYDAVGVICARIKASFGVRPIQGTYAESDVLRLCECQI